MKQVQPGGVLRFRNETFEITGGNLWLDRQVRAVAGLTLIQYVQTYQNHTTVLGLHARRDNVDVLTP